MRYHSQAVVSQLAAPPRPDFTRRAIKKQPSGARGRQVRLQTAAEQINSRVRQGDETPSLLRSVLFENFSEMGGICSPPSCSSFSPFFFSPRRDLQSDTNTRSFSSAVCSPKTTPGYLKLIPRAAFPPMIT